MGNTMCGRRLRNYRTVEEPQTLRAAPRVLDHCWNNGCRNQWEAWEQRVRAVEAAQRRPMAEPADQRLRARPEAGSTEGGGPVAGSWVAVADGLPGGEAGGDPAGPRGADLHGPPILDEVQPYITLSTASAQTMFYRIGDTWTTTELPRTPPPSCACGDRSLTPWEHAPEGCTWTGE